MSKILLFFSLVLMAAFHLEAAEPSYEVRFPAGEASWMVTLKKEAEDKGTAGKKTGAPRTIESISVARKGTLRRDTVLWTDGTTTEYWWPDKINVVLFQTEKNGPVRTMKAGIMGNRRFDETLFSWVNASTFLESKTFQKKKCSYHEVLMKGEEGESYRYYAWIEEETGRPAAWSDGVTTAVFSFDVPAPAGGLVMSDSFQKKLKQMEAYYSAPKKSGT